MIGIVVAAHGNLGGELIRTAEDVIGKIEQCVAVDLHDLAHATERFSAAVQSVDKGDGILILTDMFGGTPSNLAISCMSRPKVEVLAGINLPMLVKLAKVREERSLPDAIAMAQEAGRKYVTIASRVLAGK